MSREDWFRHYERALNEIEDAYPAMDRECAETLAAGVASQRQVNEIADRIDLARMERKEKTWLTK